MQLTKNFHSNEFKSKDGFTVPLGLMPNVQRLARNLQVLRDHVQRPVYVRSGYRTHKHNKAVGGAPGSQHPKAKAGDIEVPGYTPKQLYDTIEELIAAGKMEQGGLGLYPTFVHYDVRGKKARW